MGSTEKMTEEVTNPFDEIISSFDTQDVADVNIGTEEKPVMIKVRKQLTFTERTALISDIVAMFFSVTEENRTYRPYVRKLAFDTNLLRYFTDAPVPESVESLWALVNSIDVFGLVSGVAGYKTVNDIVADADEMIEFGKSSLLRGTVYTDVVESALEAISTIKERLGGIDTDNIVEQVSKAFPDIKEKIEQAFTETVDEVGPRKQK